ncbi:MAG: Mur ligase family protein [Candidatus Thermoplasmatota archaeon]
MDYHDALRYIYGLQYLGVKFGLENTLELLRRLGNPHQRYMSVHVAGTNGKGSVCAFIERVLREAGFRTGLYTSPHLIDYTERMQVNGVPAGREEIATLFEEVKGHIEEMRPDMRCTFFETTTALAFRYFEEKGVEIAVVETGMGGRLDSTNVIMPKVAVITDIGMEHTKHLGSTISQIAREKAGIIKPGVDAVTSEQEEGAMTELSMRARGCGSTLYALGKEFDAERMSVKDRGQRLLYKGLYDNMTIEIRLLGKHQVRNAAVALCALELLREGGLKISGRAIKGGMKMAKWPARLQIIRRSPVIVIDGAHNPAGAGALADSWDEVFRDRRVFVVMGILADKDCMSTAAPLVDRACELIATAPRNERALAASRFAEVVGAREYHDCSADAIIAALRKAKNRDAVLVVGSLYLAGEALFFFSALPPDPSEVCSRLRAEYDVGGEERGERDPFHVLVATILSHRTKDEHTHRAAEALLERYPTPGQLASAPHEDIEHLIRPAGFYRVKARYLKDAAKKIVEEFGGAVPGDINKLMSIPAVGRKTANCVLVYGFGMPAIPVDVHVHRVSNRLGLVSTTHPHDTEERLSALVPRQYWIEINRLMVRHGQETCHPLRPRCPVCVLRDLCMHWRRTFSAPTSL